MPYLTRKIRLPPTNRRGIRTYYRRRGYMENPVMQSRQRARMTFVKPLPDGRRIHDRIYEFKRHYKIERHIDRFDPGRSPIRHVLIDRMRTVPTRTFRVPRRTTPDSALRRVRKALGILI